MTWLDGGALAFFLAVWILLSWLIDKSPWHKHTLSAAMKFQRREWMRQMAGRQVRLVDANIITGLQQATSFFASTALLAVGAGFALLTAADTIIAVFEESFAHLQIDRATFYVKTAFLMGLYAYAFFKFGWAYRLFNYSAVMLAATPEAGDPGAEEAAAAVAEMNIAAAGQFTHGLRAFFLAIAVLAWFITWWGFVIATSVIVLALANRQFNSRARFVTQDVMARMKGKT
ncbi:MAG: DUF599 family protein [Burkholderiales bacterium]|jgi:uncharacterized membrane protein|nr:MAG: DUF599 family protein [Burkholderiales bacterium]